MNKSVWIMIAGLMLVCAACQPDCICPPPTADPNTNVFSAPYTGKMSRYVFFKGEKYWDRALNDFEYGNDTLEVEIISSRRSKYFRVEERFSTGSAIMKKIRNAEIAMDSVYQYDLTRHEDQWIFESGSKGQYQPFPSPLLGFRLEDTFRLAIVPPIELKECDAIGKKIFDCRDFAKISNWQFGQQLYDPILIYFGMDEIIADGPSYVWYYSERAGIPQAFTISSWTQQWQGWEWIKE